MDQDGCVVNRTQALVLAFFGMVWASLVTVLVAAPDVYDRVFNVHGHGWWGRLAFLGCISILIALLVIGVLRRWRWTFWLITVAFIAGALRVPASALQIAGVLPAAGPAWYTLLQGVLGLVQFAIGLALLAGWHRGGVWGAF